MLVVVDYYSRYYEVAILQSTTTGKVIECLEDIFSRHGLPISVKSDRGSQFISDEFREYCEQNNIAHCKVTAIWAQANGEVKRQNASLFKRLQIAQAESRDWRKEMRKYLTSYRGIEHATTGKSPAELLFNRKMRNKLPDISTNPLLDMEVRDRDAEQKGKAKVYADARRGERYSAVSVGDKVLVRQDKVNKLTTTFGATPFTVVNKNGNSLTVESPDGAQYSRNTTHVGRYLSGVEDPPNDADDGENMDTETATIEATERDAPVPSSPPTEPRATRPLREIRMPKKYDYFIT